MKIEEDEFLTFVMNEAENIGKVFVLDCGEGNSAIDEINGYEIEELSGWLINKSDVEKIISSRKNKTAYTDFSNEYVFAKWSKSEDGTVSISFKSF